MLTLRPYQTEIVRAVHESWRMGYKRPLVCLPTGGGKTALAADMCRRIAEAGTTAWFLVHRRELLKQTLDTFDMFGIPLDRIHVGMVWTALRKEWPKPDLIIYDECSVAGTKVDGKNIEDLSVGDMVESFNHTTRQLEFKPITRIFKKKAPDELVLINGYLVCTRNHPVYIHEKGAYVNAEELIEGEHMLFRVWDEGALERHAEAQERFMAQEQKSVLLRQMPGPVSPGSEQSDHERNKSSAHRDPVGSDEEKQPDAYARGQEKDGSNLERNGTQATDTRWERETYAGATSKAVESVASSRGHSRTCGEHEIVQKQEKQVSDTLQDRYSATETENSNRGGWVVSQDAGKAGPGSKERELLGYDWVDSIEILERGSDGRYEKMCGDGYVYNIEVADNHNYFANNILVHNCHHSTARSWQRVTETHPDAFLTGLTATPARLDGKALGDVFDRLVIGPATADLIDQGWLSPYRMIVADVADLAGLKTRGADFDPGDAASRLMERAVYGDVVKAYREFGQAQAIYFCTTIRHSEATAEAFQAAGIRAEHFDGNTPAKDRDRLIEQFRAGDIQILSNCELIGEGFDMPACDVVGMLRPTQSLTVYLQQVGRALRPRAGKLATLIDHVGNIQRHGSPSEPRAWSLEGRIKTGRAVTEEGEFAIRYCRICFAAFEVTKPRCPVCGALYEPTTEEIKQIRDVKMMILEEERLEREKAWAMSPDAEESARSYSDFCKIAKHKGYSKGWARCRAKDRGYWTPY